MTVDVVFVPMEGNLYKMTVKLPHTAKIRDLKKVVGARTEKNPNMVLT